MTMATDFFPQRPDAHPMIYAYEDTNPQYQGLLKVGYTAIDVDKRVAQQYPTKRPDGSVPYRIVYRESAMYPDGSSFTDHDVHRVLKRKKITGMGGEWFRCTVDDVRAAVLAVKKYTANEENRDLDFPMRPEQQSAVKSASDYFKKIKEEGIIVSPKFLWNCKMRFGKTFAAYQLAKRMKCKRVLILTFKPAVVSAWQEDLNSHIDFEGWQFISRNTELTYETADKSRPIVCFGSFQDYLGYDRNTGGVKPRNEWVHGTQWNLVIFDEYHFGAWKENARKLFEDGEDEDDYEEDLTEYNRGNAYDESFLPITTDYYLYLSGTPFRAINSGEFIEEQIYNWTYSDEQSAKENWDEKKGTNPYAALPRMVMMTYRLPESIWQIALKGEFNEFDLNEFFSAEGREEQARFVHENEVQKWLDLIRGGYLETQLDNLKMGSEKPALPYSDIRLLNVLQHTLWFLPNVAACHAMSNLLKQRQNKFYHDYIVNVCAGTRAGIGVKALEPVQKSMEEPLESKSITLSCGKLTTGVTVKPWTGIFMLRSLSSPETYFQAAFRVQSPWEILTDDGKTEIIKKECYIFDFAPNRALRQIADYSCQLAQERNPEKKVGEFIKFLPVLAYDGSSMRQIDAGEVLDMAISGTSSTMLAKRWESALLVNVDNDTLSRLMANPAAMEALMKIEGFRSLNQDIETIINQSEAVKKVKKEGVDNLSPSEKKQLSQEEKEYKNKRKEIQEKLIKLATRIPIFMYLTDYREYSLQDVIRRLEEQLFKKVTGLNVKEFDLLCSLGLFNSGLMNDAVYKFKRYEDKSLEYTGINRHEGEDRGLWDTVLKEKEYQQLYRLQQESMEAPIPSEDDLPGTPYGTEEENEGEGADVSEEEKTSPRVRKSDKRFATRKTALSREEEELVQKGVRVGTVLRHKIFGVGILKKIENSLLTIDFGKSYELKKFRSPNAFEQGFLSYPSERGEIPK